MIYVKTTAARWARLPGAAGRPIGRPIGRLARLGRAMLASALLLSGPAWALDIASGGQRLPAVSLTAGMHLIRAEVAATPEQRAIGLMHRRDLAPNDGMLFVFDQPSPQCFWMKNTPTPLTIAFLADDGSIVNLADMTPFDERSHCSAKPVRLVLEMHQGWFAKRGIQAGFRLSGAPFKR